MNLLPLHTHCNSYKCNSQVFLTTFCNFFSLLFATFSEIIYVLTSNKGEITMEFKDRLKQLRTMRGLSQVDLADKINISKSTIGAYEIGIRMPGREATRKLSEFFHVSPGYLMGDEEEYFMFAPDYMPMLQDDAFLEMLDNYYQLNEEGQEIARSTVAGLVASGRYIKTDEDGMVGA